MSLSTLPFELTSMVLSCDKITSHDLSSVARVNKSFNAIATPILYRKVRFFKDRPWGNGSPVAIPTCDKLRRFTQTLVEIPGRAALIRYFAFKAHGNNYAEDNEDSNGGFFSFENFEDRLEFPALKELALPRVEVAFADALTLFQHPRIENLSIRWIVSEPPVGTFLGFKRVQAVEGGPYSSSKLKRLELAEWVRPDQCTKRLLGHCRSLQSLLWAINLFYPSEPETLLMVTLRHMIAPLGNTLQRLVLRFGTENSVTDEFLTIQFSYNPSVVDSQFSWAGEQDLVENSTWIEELALYKPNQSPNLSHDIFPDSTEDAKVQAALKAYSLKMQIDNRLFFAERIKEIKAMKLPTLRDEVSRLARFWIEGNPCSEWPLHGHRLSVMGSSYSSSKYEALWLSDDSVEEVEDVLSFAHPLENGIELGKSNYTQHWDRAQIECMERHINIRADLNIKVPLRLNDEFLSFVKYASRGVKDPDFRKSGICEFYPRWGTSNRDDPRIMSHVSIWKDPQDRSRWNWNRDGREMRYFHFDGQRVDVLSQCFAGCTSWIPDALVTPDTGRLWSSYYILCKKGETGSVDEIGSSPEQYTEASGLY
ncbi:hypothetical protein IFR05_010900 [Cadophora sp. M221]|nr:hypothetical protein IFR05_010900 [Cadophora sp. M221]